MRTFTLGCLLMLACTASWATYGVRVSDLKYTPTPPNPVRVWGKVVSESPLKISDGRGEIEVVGITATNQEYLVATGDWDGSVLTCKAPASTVIGPAHIEVIGIPAGSFQMGNTGVKNDAAYGDNDELPQHSVYLSGYWIGKCEVTRAQYGLFIDAGGYGERSYWSDAGWDWITSHNRTQPDYWLELQDWGKPGSFTQTGNYPVVGVTYYEAEAFCKWAGGHLPTEAQWEKAARWTGTHANIYPWGDTWNSEKCNNFSDSSPAGGGFEARRTSAVGSYPTGMSPSGCQDMAGNVWEWCQDVYSGNYYSQTPTGGWTDPQGPSTGAYRALRGGSWLFYGDYYARCAYRGWDAPDSHWSDYGFRFAR